MVVQPGVAQQGLLQILARMEAMRSEHIGDAPVETLDHSVGLGRSGPDQPMLDVHSSLQKRRSGRAPRGAIVAPAPTSDKSG